MPMLGVIMPMIRRHNANDRHFKVTVGIIMAMIGIAMLITGTTMSTMGIMMLIIGAQAGGAGTRQVCARPVQPL